jgi:hypothetical protein
MAPRPRLATEQLLQAGEQGPAPLKVFGELTRNDDGGLVKPPVPGGPKPSGVGVLGAHGGTNLRISVRAWESWRGD